MGMFAELLALSTDTTLTMIVSGDAASEKMTVHVVPKAKPGVDEPALCKALSLTATPDEFEIGFVEALRGYREVRQSLLQQAEVTKEILEAAKLASSKKANQAANAVKSAGKRVVPPAPAQAAKTTVTPATSASSVPAPANAAPASPVISAIEPQGAEALAPAKAQEESQPERWETYDLFG